MSKPVIAVVVCTLLALALPLLRVPTSTQFNNVRLTAADEKPEVFKIIEPYYIYDGKTIWWLWVWEHRFERRWQESPSTTTVIIPSDGVATVRLAIRWPIVFATQSLIVLLGGGLLTFVVRRDGRRRAAA